MDPASLSLGVVGVLGSVQLCARLGATLVELYKAYNTADQDLNDRITRVSGIWLKTDEQIKVLRRIHESTKDKTTSKQVLESHQATVLDRLLDILRNAIFEIARFTGTGIDLNQVSGKEPAILSRFQRINALVFKKHLNRIETDLKGWQSVFDPSWFLLTLLANDKIDDLLRQSNRPEPSNSRLSSLKMLRDAVKEGLAATGDLNTVFKDPSYVVDERHFIPGSSCAVTEGSKSSIEILAQTTEYPIGLPHAVIADGVQVLALLLRDCDPDVLGLLNCVGAIPLARDSLQYELLFRLPRGMKLKGSLRSMLYSPIVSLDERFAMAKSLSRAVLSIHCAGLVHKSVRPDNVLVLESTKDRSLKTFLVGFELFRKFDASSLSTGDGVWYRNLYRHPYRQKIEQDERYIMEHDIYSLGVCLLEIGLWSPFIQSTMHSSAVQQATREPSQWEVGPELKNIMPVEPIAKPRMRLASKIKDHFVSLAKTRLPSAMGSAYTEIVVSCLTCLDQDLKNPFTSTPEMYDEDGLVVGVKFIQNVLQVLEGVHVGTNRD